MTLSSDHRTLSELPLGTAIAKTSVLTGLDASPITVEVTASRGPSTFQLVGLADVAVREARVRVSMALARLGVLLGEHAVTVNLAPADLRKRSTGLDVAIALALLGALERLPATSLEGVLLVGELSLEGALRPVRGVLPQLLGAREAGMRRAIVPLGNKREAGLVRGLEVFVAGSLESIVLHLCGEQELERVTETKHEPEPIASSRDLKFVRGQGTARRALEIAAVGGHNLLMLGPPGTGKTLLARLLPSILPPLTFDEAIATTAIHSVAGLVDPEIGMVKTRPFRAPHHSVSEAGLVGGGGNPRPGEISLAHNGVLFLDELAEFRRNALEALRQPLEDGVVCIARARARAWFPARPMLVAATNPCPCGHFGVAARPCRCSEHERNRYRSRLSGPLLDRIDLHVCVPPVEPGALIDTELGESSGAVRERVLAARERGRRRAERLGLASRLNAELGDAELDRVVQLDAEGRGMIEQALHGLRLSARAFTRIRRVARSLADLEGSESVRGPHVAEAIQGRVLEQGPRSDRATRR